MFRKTILALSLALGLVPRGASGQGREWEEDYTGERTGPPQPDYDVSVDVGGSGSVSFDSFHESLAPYGDWVTTSYGLAWRPHVAAGWRPYYYGRWEWTDEGWMWVSDEPWGWAAYHYGRWAFDPGAGWIWVPGYQWAPAWVSWRFSAGTVGWAPLAPGLSVYVTSYPFVDAWWTFVPMGSFVGVSVHGCAYPPAYTRRYFYETAPAPPRTAPRPAPAGSVRLAPAPAWGGPAPAFVSQRIGRPVTPVRVVPAPSPGAASPQSGVVAVYRPEARPVPSPARGPGTVGSPVPDGRAGWGRGSAPVPGMGERREGWSVGRGPGPAPAPGYRTGAEARGAGYAPPRPAGAPVSRGAAGMAPRGAAPRGGTLSHGVAPAPAMREHR
ncbi:MAG TPA: DUF6600 domain-containing protein [Anaeromyxobacteraceae bacterium]|nr:DUF6600 domain-containing protein [Anaeromyxobacteraceae bacterium]